MAIDKPEVAPRARRRIAYRILPFVMVMYLVCYIDRANVSFANLRMSADLGFADRIYGLGVGMFFIGYVLFEVPGALIVERWSARKWLARILISWGLITILNGFIHTPRQFYLARLLVGISEASFAPGIMVYLTRWFRESDRAKAIGCFFIGTPAASSLGAIIAGWLLGVRWLGIAGWRWLFILEGIPPIVLGAVALFYLTDWPRDAHWLTEDERDWIVKELAAETAAKKKVRDYSIWEAFRDWRISLLTVAWLLSLTATLSSTYWLPAFIKRLSHLPDTRVALLGALPGLLGIAGLLVNGWHSDKTAERKWHAVLPLVGAGASFLLVLRTGGHYAIAVALFSLGVAMFYWYQPVLWTMPTMILCESAAAASFGLINSVGQLGGFVGPYVVSYLNEKTGSVQAAFVFIGVTYFLSALVLSFVKIHSPVRDASMRMPQQLAAEET
jgi:MFS transporter, ACS family, tartrate transporter